MPLIKINSKWIIDLNVKCKAMRLIEGNIGENLGDHSYGDYLGKTGNPWIFGKLNFFNIENFCSV